GLLQQALDHGGAEVDGGHIGQRALETANRGARGGNDDDVLHDGYSARSKVISGTCSGTIRRPAVFSMISSTLTPGARSRRTKAPSSISREARSVSTLRMQPAPVSGSEQRSSNLDSPFLEAWVMVTMMFSAPATRSIAPPMPLTSLPGIIQEAMLPCTSTSKAPSTVRSTWPPRIMAKDWAESKMAAPGRAVTVCLPALIMSASS